MRKASQENKEGARERNEQTQQHMKKSAGEGTASSNYSSSVSTALNLCVKQQILKRRRGMLGW